MRSCLVQADIPFFTACPPLLLPQADGTSCDDGNACTTADLCVSGTCYGFPISCPAADACHAPGTCDAGSGSCLPGAPLVRQAEGDEGRKPPLLCEPDHMPCCPFQPYACDAPHSTRYLNKVVACTCSMPIHDAPHSTRYLNKVGLIAPVACLYMMPLTPPAT